MTRFTVTAEQGRTPGIWIFQCREFPGAISQSKRLRDAVPLMTEAIAFVAQIDPEAVEIVVVPQLPHDLDSEVRAAKEAVRDLQEQQATAAQLSRRAARRLREAGLTGSDAAVVLGISPQRVSQLLRDSG